MVSGADVRGYVRLLLQDEDDTNYVWSDAVIDQFVNEGVRRLGPKCFKKVSVKVVPDGSTLAWVLGDVLLADVIDVERIVSDVEDLEGRWDVYAGSLYFSDAPQNDFYVRAAVSYAAVADIPDSLVDAVKYYAAGHCLEFLVKRGGAALRRYLADQGDLVEREIEMLGQSYLTEWATIREDNASSVAGRS